MGSVLHPSTRRHLFSATTGARTAGWPSSKCVTLGWARGWGRATLSFPGEEKCRAHVPRVKGAPFHDVVASSGVIPGSSWLVCTPSYPLARHPRLSFSAPHCYLLNPNSIILYSNPHWPSQPLPTLPILKKAKVILENIHQITSPPCLDSSNGFLCVVNGFRR